MTAIGFDRDLLKHLAGPPTRAVRAGQLVPVTCAACGCRLEGRREGDPALDEGWTSWWHFRGGPFRDARGCTVACIGLEHRVDGSSIA